MQSEYPGEGGGGYRTFKIKPFLVRIMVMHRRRLCRFNVSRPAPKPVAGSATVKVSDMIQCLCSSTFISSMISNVVLQLFNIYTIFVPYNFKLCKNDKIYSNFICVHHIFRENKIIRWYWFKFQILYIYVHHTQINNWASFHPAVTSKYFDKYNSIQSFWFWFYNGGLWEI